MLRGRRGASSAHPRGARPLRARSPPPSTPLPPRPPAEHITPLEQEITQLADAIYQIEDQQEYLYARERAAREVSEQTNARVLWYALAEAAVLILVAVWQVRSLRGFFEIKRAM